MLQIEINILLFALLVLMNISHVIMPRINSIISGDAVFFISPYNLLVTVKFNP